MWKTLFKPIDLGIKVELILKIFIVALFSSLLMGSAIYKLIELSFIQREIIHINRVKDLILREYQLKGFETENIPGFKPEHFGLTSICIMDNDNKVIFGDCKGLYGRKKKKTGIFLYRKGLLLPSFKGISGVFSITKENQNYFLFLYNRLDSMNDTLTHIRKVILLLVVLTTALILFLLNFLLNKTITTPIKSMIQDINAIKLNKKEIIEGVFLKELKYLTMNFNELLTEKRIRQKELKKKIEELEKLNIILSRYQKEMVKIEKLASLDRLSAGVAHEIGNPLNNILGYLSLLKSQLKPSDNTEVFDYISRIESELKRIDAIIRGMLSLTKERGGLNISPCNVVELLEETLPLIRMMYKGKVIEIKKEYDSNHVCLCLVDTNGLQQVLLNLLSNAIDSIEESGLIEIGVLEKYHLTELEKECLQISGYASEGSFAKIVIKDNGKGINKSDFDHVFDPFFTTKDPGKGTGLGLSISARLMKEMGGNIQLFSEEGKGTVAEILLRRA